MKIAVECITHHAAGVPAGDKYHWIARAQVASDGSGHVQFELDHGDLYCTAEPDGRDHDFKVIVYFSDDVWLARTDDDTYDEMVPIELAVLQESELNTAWRTYVTESNFEGTKTSLEDFGHYLQHRNDWINDIDEN